MKLDYDYESELRIDPDYLDREWLEQPMRFARVARLSAEARKTMDEAKEGLDMVRATVDAAVRARPEG